MTTVFTCDCLDRTILIPRTILIIRAWRVIRVYEVKSACRGRSRAMRPRMRYGYPLRPAYYRTCAYCKASSRMHSGTALWQIGAG